jgi:hypothetical protein
LGNFGQDGLGLRYRALAKARVDGLVCEASIAFRIPRSLHWIASPLCFLVSLAEIEKVVDELSAKGLTKLAAYITRRDKLAWDQEIEEDFAPGGKHQKALEKIDAEIDSGNFTRLP